MRILWEDECKTLFDTYGGKPCGNHNWHLERLGRKYTVNVTADVDAGDGSGNANLKIVFQATEGGNVNTALRFFIRDVESETERKESGSRSTKYEA